MARKFIQSSVACDAQGVLYVGVCDDGSMWSSDNGKPWIRLDPVPEDAPDTKEENSNNTQQLKAEIAVIVKRCEIAPKSFRHHLILDTDLERLLQLSSD